ncbi:MAG: hypothetical protein LBL75_04005 [Rickettsiales bacterium]|jgi:hypothetical protein|nr:hypothetical protein [Rickettsiales bacterium]
MNKTTKNMQLSLEILFHRYGKDISNNNPHIIECSKCSNIGCNFNGFVETCPTMHLFAKELKSAIKSEPLFEAYSGLKNGNYVCNTDTKLNPVKTAHKYTLSLPHLKYTALVPNNDITSAMDFTAFIKSFIKRNSLQK